MKVFVAGGSGAMGRRLVPRLVAEGYEVAAMTRDAGKAAWLSAVGAQPVVADALDRAAVRAAVVDAGPEVVIHQLTALSGAASNLKQFDREFALTNRPRGASSRKATATGTTRAPARARRPSGTRSTPLPRRTRSSPWRRSGTWRAR